MINLDDYEIHFIENKLESVGNGKGFQKALILECLELFQSCTDSIYKNKVIELCSDELISRMIDFVERSTFYENLFIFWDRKLTSKNPGFFTIENAIHTFYPIYCQEVEGPLKNSLLVIDFILRISKGKMKLTWSNYKYIKMKNDELRFKYITEVLDTLKESSKNTNFIKEVIKGLNSPPLTIRILRNAGAHSNYVYNKDKDIIIISPESNEPIEITALDFLEIFSMTEDLIKILHLIIHLGCRRIEFSD